LCKKLKCNNYKETEGVVNPIKGCVDITRIAQDAERKYFQHRQRKVGERYESC